MRASSPPEFVFCSDFINQFPEETRELRELNHADIISHSCGCDIQFPDGEISAELPRGCLSNEVIILQCLISQNENTLHNSVFRLLAVIRAYRDFGAKNITVFIPYLPYTRQDRIIEGEFRPLTSKLFSDLIRAAGAQHLITLETGATERLKEVFLPLKLDFISTKNFILNAIDLVSSDLDYVLVAPDQGAAKSVKCIATELNAKWIEFGKKRINAESVVTHKRNVFRPNNIFSAIIIDDLVCSGATVENVCYQLIELGFSKVSLIVPHLRLTPKGIVTINNMAHAGILDSVITSNSIPYDSLPSIVRVIKKLNLIKLFSIDFNEIGINKQVGYYE